MAKLTRVGAVNWTVLAAGLSLLGTACSADDPAGNPAGEGAAGASAAAGTAGASATAGTGGALTAMAGGSGANPAASGAAGSTAGAASGVAGAPPATAGTGGGDTAASGSSTGGTPGMSGGAGGSAGMMSAAGAAGQASAGAGGEAGMDGGEAGAGTTDSGPYNPDFVEFYGEDCDVGEPQDVNDPKLPDLFAAFDGTRMSKKSDWRCQRAALKKAVETYIHGEKPGTPDTVTGTVSNGSISVHVEHAGKTIDFSVMLSIPGGAASPAPAMIGLGGGSLRGSILSEEGVATINFNNNSLASETSRSGLFTDIYGNTGASAQVGWAWGVSRIIDVLVSERDAGRNDLIDPTAIGVTGCSRLGKGAFTIGAFDERIALGVPQESGTGGVSALRILNEAIVGPNGQPSQSIASAWSEAQGWFGEVFGNYRNNVDVMPVDMHSLVAMYAPRGLLVLDNSRIGELGSVAQHAASAAGGEVYKALGAEKNIEYHGGNASDPHNHCSFYDSQADPLRRAIRAHLTRTEEPDGRIAPAAVATANMADWVEWETPTLAD